MALNVPINNVGFFGNTHLVLRQEKPLSSVLAPTESKNSKIYLPLFLSPIFNFQLTWRRPSDSNRDTVSLRLLIVFKTISLPIRIRTPYKEQDSSYSLTHSPKTTGAIHRKNQKRSCKPLLPKSINTFSIII